MTVFSFQASVLRICTLGIAFLAISGRVARADSSGSLACDDSNGKAIYTNKADGDHVVSLTYTHGCSWGILTPVVKVGSGEPQYIEGCDGIAASESHTCSVTVPKGTSIWLTVAGGHGSTGESHFLSDDTTHTWSLIGD